MNHKQKVIIEKYKKWDYVDDSGYYIWINRYGDVVRTEDVNGNPKRTFSRETYQDMQIYGIDVEAELTAMLSIEMTKEIDKQIDKQIIQEIIKREKEEIILTRIVLFEKTHKTNIFLGYKGHSYLEAGYVYAPYVPIYSTSEPVSSKTLETATVISQYSQQVATANYVVCSPQVAVVLKQLL